MLTANREFKSKTEVFSQDQRRSFRLSALLHVAHVQPVCEAASAIALLRQHDPEHAREVMANQPSLFSTPFSSKARLGREPMGHQMSVLGAKPTSLRHVAVIFF